MPKIAERARKFLEQDDKPRQLLARAGQARQSADALMRVLYVDYLVEADCDYLQELMNLRTQLSMAEYEGLGPRSRASREVPTSESGEIEFRADAVPEVVDLSKPVDKHAAKKPPKGESVRAIVTRAMLDPRVGPQDTETLFDRTWNDPSNLALREMRKREDRLSPGDVVRVRFTQPLRPRRLSASGRWTGDVHALDDSVVNYGRSAQGLPDNWRELIGGMREDPITRDSYLLTYVGELADAMEMLQYKLDVMDRVCKRWEQIAADAQPLQALRRKWKADEQALRARITEKERERRKTLSHHSGGNSKDRRMLAKSDVAAKSRAKDELSLKRKTYREEESSLSTQLRVKVDARILAHGKDIPQLFGRVSPDRRNIRARLELAGCLLLPHPCPMGGVFPSHEYCVISRSAQEASRYDFLIQHANRLIRKYEFLETDKARRVLDSRDGCICIMFAEELSSDGEHYVYVPFFGISGGASADFPRDTYLKRLGVPSLEGEQSNPEASAKMGRAGERLVERFFKLFKFFDQRKALNLKVPAKQAMLSYMGYMDADWLTEHALHQHLHNIESWNSIQCAEPSAVMAAAQLYYRMADMELSVPFEGEVRIDFKDHSGNGWGKETCGRCAISEMTFAGVVKSGDRKQVRMKSVIMRKEDVDEAHAKDRLEFKAALGPELVYNRDRSREAYGARPLMDSITKRDEQFPAMERFHGLGIAQSSSRPFWQNNRKQGRPLPSPSPDAIPALIQRYGLQGIFCADAGEDSRRAVLDPAAAFKALQEDARGHQKELQATLDRASRKEGGTDFDVTLQQALALSVLVQIDGAKSLDEAYRELRSLPDSVSLSGTSDAAMHGFVLNAMVEALAGIQSSFPEAHDPFTPGADAFSSPVEAWTTVGSHSLTSEHRRMLETERTEYLEDRVIDAFVAVIEQSRARVSSRYDIPVGVLVGNGRWVPPQGLQTPRTGATVELQVLNVGGNHWVLAVRFPGESQTAAYLYDPLQRGPPSPELKTRVRRCFGRHDLVVTALTGPRQPGGHECGAYVSAAIEVLTRDPQTPETAREALRRALFNNDTIRGNMFQSLQDNALHWM
ncbi:hypothetical protein [Corallococcus exercitus]|uniref:hypothetical protein n=1 Tax=Corallococcus exercitus TaxID=2316736 RepID=UPI0011C47DD3|nr:hypothetical protein [Corallococcus exercitus]